MAYKMEIVNGLKWRFKGSKCVTIMQAPKGVSGDVVIPSSLGGAKVTNIHKSAFNGCRNIKSVTIPDSVNICRAMFVGCRSLESITISANMTMVGGYRENRDEYKQYWEYRGVWRNQDWFSMCPSLLEIKVPKNNPTYKSANGLLLSKDGKTLLAVPCGLTSVTIPRGVQKIGPGAFKGCKKLEKVKIPEGVTSIGTYAFRGCHRLESVTTPKSMRDIKEGAFMDCFKLKRVTISAGVQEISETETFEGCKGLCEFVVDSRNPKYESINGFLVENVVREGIAEWTGEKRPKGKLLLWTPGILTKIMIPDGVECIRHHAFYACCRD